VVVIASSSGWNGGYGKTILISHSNGKTTRYGHLNSVDVTVGERVSQGEQIGRSGSTGRSTGPHLHFELRVNGIVKSPF
jgi:murein DD-endopeptidase MepM/ murein hydrolase activator NlpD